VTTVGGGLDTSEVFEPWAVLPTGWTLGGVSAVATDSQDRVYAFQRKDPPVLVFDRNGTRRGLAGPSEQSRRRPGRPARARGRTLLAAASVPDIGTS
jgi:hypothetical protein